MTKKDFFSKLKNYNNELEQILEKKTFSGDIKNLLLNMFYKIEVSYKDYQKVKRVTKEQNNLMEELINIIKPKIAVPTHYAAIVGAKEDYYVESSNTRQENTQQNNQQNDQPSGSIVTAKSTRLSNGKQSDDDEKRRRDNAYRKRYGVNRANSRS